MGVWREVTTDCRDERRRTRRHSGFRGIAALGRRDARARIPGCGRTSLAEQPRAACNGTYALVLLDGTERRFGRDRHGCDGRCYVRLEPATCARREHVSSAAVGVLTRYRTRARPRRVEATARGAHECTTAWVTTLELGHPFTAFRADGSVRVERPRSRQGNLSRSREGR
jgi:hypothetical protein